MSHVTTIDLHITDLDSLAKACERLGLELVTGQKTFKWYGQWVGDYRGQDAAFNQGIDTKDYGKCEHAIRVKGNKQAYEIGLVKRTDGKAGYRLVWDHYAGGFGLCEKVQYNAKTVNADKLKDWYAAEVSKKQMRRQGFRVNAKQLDGKVQVLCSK
jgi:hypothetical protein